MVSMRVVRVCAGALAALATLGASASAGLIPIPTPVPSIAVGAGQTRVAWLGSASASYGPNLHSATRNADGTFSPDAVTQSANGSPVIGLAPDGTEALMTKSNNNLFSAFHRPGEPLGRLEYLFTTATPWVPVQLAVDPAGRAIASWYATTSGGEYGPIGLYVSMRPRGGEWSVPALLAGGDGLAGFSMAGDEAGDVVIVYSVTDAPMVAGHTAVTWASTLPFGATDWTTPVPISGSDTVALAVVLSPSSVPAAPLRVAGGGGRTFLVSWLIPNAGTYTARTARLRVPGTWEAPVDLIPRSPAAVPGIDFASDVSVAVDHVGNGFGVVRSSTLLKGSSLSVATLPASQGTWTAPAALDPRGPGRSWDSTPAMAFGDDGSASVVFLRYDDNGSSLRIAESQGPLGQWRGRGTDVLLLDTCSFVLCEREWAITPQFARSGQAETIMLQTRNGFVLALTRPAPTAAWKQVTLDGSGTTRAYLDGAHVKKGSVRAVAECRLPPCQGVAVLTTADARHRVLARIPFVVRSRLAVEKAVLLPRWARQRIARTPLRTQLALDMTLADGSKAQTSLSVRLHR